MYKVIKEAKELINLLNDSFSKTSAEIIESGNMDKDDFGLYIRNISSYKYATLDIAIEKNLIYLSLHLQSSLENQIHLTIRKCGNFTEIIEETDVFVNSFSEGHKESSKSSTWFNEDTDIFELFINEFKANNSLFNAIQEGFKNTLEFLSATKDFVMENYSEPI